MRALYIAAQWLWGLPQTLAGAVAYLLAKGKGFRYRGCLAKRWRLKGSVSLGMFILLGSSLSPEQEKRVLVHEYGHTIQSLILGPLYLLAVGLPSVIWAGLSTRRPISRSYYSVYPENWANTLGEWVTGEPAER